MSNNIQEDRAAHAAAAQREVNITTYQAWLSTHPDVVPCTATLRAFEEYMDFTDVLTVADFNFAYGNLGSRLALRRVPTENQSKEALINEICDLLRSPNSDGRGGRYSEENLKSERIKISYWTVSELARRRDEIVEKQRLQRLSAGQIRQELQASRPVPPGKVLPAEYTRDRIRAMPSHEIRKLNRDYTASVVNDRLFGRS
jgi:hypothetical protein